MPLKLRCACGAKLVVSRRSIGRSVRCPRCEQKIRVELPPARKTAERAAQPKDRSDSLDSPSEPATRRQRVSYTGVPEPEPPPVQGKDGPARTDTEESPVEQLNESPPEGSEAERGYEPDRGKVATARWLAAGLATLAVCSMIPAALDAADSIRNATSSGLGRWAYLVLLAGTMQLAYTAYLAQLPDWSSIRVVSMLSLFLATGYAIFLALSVLADDPPALIQALGLSDRVRTGSATGWCFIMLCLTSLYCYLSGRISARWQTTAERWYG